MEKKAQKDKQCEQAVYQVHFQTLCWQIFEMFESSAVSMMNFILDSVDSVKSIKANERRVASSVAPPLLISPSSVLSSLYLLFNISLCVSLFLWWLPIDYLNDGKLCCAFRPHFLFHRLNSLPSSLRSSLLSPPRSISPSLPHRRSSADNTRGGPGGPGLPGNFLTNHIAVVTCCISSRSACSSVCVHCGGDSPFLVTTWQ